jgi:hypothetical protein
MQGPKINLSSDNLPLSTLKRKGVASKVIAHKSKKKKIDTIVIDIYDMAGKLARAFQVELCSTFSFLRILFYHSFT